MWAWFQFRGFAFVAACRRSMLLYGCRLLARARWKGLLAPGSRPCGGLSVVTSGDISDDLGHAFGNHARTLVMQEPFLYSPWQSQRLIGGVWQSWKDWSSKEDQGAAQRGFKGQLSPCGELFVMQRLHLQVPGNTTKTGTWRDPRQAARMKATC